MSPLIDSSWHVFSKRRRPMTIQNFPHVFARFFGIKSTSPLRLLKIYQEYQWLTSLSLRRILNQSFFLSAMLRPQTCFLFVCELVSIRLSDSKWGNSSTAKLKPVKDFLKKTKRRERSIWLQLVHGIKGETPAMRSPAHKPHISLCGFFNISSFQFHTEKDEGIGHQTLHLLEQPTGWQLADKKKVLQ